VRGDRGISGSSEDEEGFTEGESCRFMAARWSEREERLGLRRQAVKMARRGALDGPDLFIECAGWTDGSFWESTGVIFEFTSRHASI
jgi:hypothetical protein